MVRAKWRGGSGRTWPKGVARTSGRTSSASSRSLLWEAAIGTGCYASSRSSKHSLPPTLTTRSASSAEPAIGYGAAARLRAGIALPNDMAADAARMMESSELVRAQLDPFARSDARKRRGNRAWPARLRAGIAPRRSRRSVGRAPPFAGDDVGHARTLGHARRNRSHGWSTALPTAAAWHRRCSRRSQKSGQARPRHVTIDSQCAGLRRHQPVAAHPVREHGHAQPA